MIGFTRDAVDIRTPTSVGEHGARRLEALRLGDWAVHRSIDCGDHFVITLLPLGLCLPPDFASFRTERAACAAVVEIVRIRNDWHRIEQADLTIALRDQITAICARHGALMDGPVGVQGHADRTLMGRSKSSRLNGYAQPN